MKILGWHGGLVAREHEDGGFHYGRHDAAAVLVNEREIVAAFEEERLNRVKHANCFPARAVEQCLKVGGLTLHDLDHIVVNRKETWLDEFVLSRRLEDPSFEPETGRQLVASLFEKTFGEDVREKVRFCDHHLAHACSAFIPAGFDRALIFCPDGNGDGLSGIVAIGDGTQIEILRSIPETQSLGHFYIQCIMLMGYRRFDEYKVMGLAPYGDPNVFGPIVTGLYRLLPEGRYELLEPSQRWRLLQRAGLMRGVRRRHQPFSKREANLAAALQRALEVIVLHVLSHFRRSTGLSKLCLAGGVAHNCSMNGVIARSRLFDSLFVQPAAHDAGTALGAALWMANKAGAPRFASDRVASAYLGTPVGTAEDIARKLAAWQDFIHCRVEEDVTVTGARLLADQRVVGWVQGRAEFGPRALGNRSILADPRPLENREKINAMVKKRESFRPFAPAVLEERAADFFDLGIVGHLPGMTVVVDVLPSQRRILQAVTHVDGTARLQTVSRRDNPAFYDLIKAFGELTGIPVVLNTSFNSRDEPMVDTVDDGITCMLTTTIDALIIGNQLVTPRRIEPDDPAWEQLVLDLRPTKKLIQGSERDSMGNTSRTYAIESHASDYFGERSVPISLGMYRLLSFATGQRTLGQLLGEACISDREKRRAIVKEAWGLWARRALVLRPAALELS